MYVHVFQAVEIPLLKVTKKVKSMQMFHKPVQRAMQVQVKPIHLLHNYNMYSVYTVHGTVHVCTCTVV